MARNRVQFQKGLSEAAFEELYGTEEKCRAAVMASRWPNGFECPACEGRVYSEVTTRRLFQCSACRLQTSLTAGTIFASTHLPLRLWFRAMYHLTQSKQGISSVELGRRLGVKQFTAWKIKHKLAQVMMERDGGKRFSGRVEIDDAYLGGERTGGKRGRGAPGKTSFVAAVETTPEGKPVRLKLRRVASFCNHAIAGFAKRSLDPNCEVVSDGRACLGAVKEAGCKHEVIKTGSGPAAAQVPAFKWVNTAWQHQGGYRRNLPGHSREAPALGDLGYRGKRLAEAGQALGITVEAIARGREGRFVPAGICWVVERSFAWISRYRRLNTIFERSKEHLIAFVAIAFISILARRLKCLVAEDCSA